MGFNKYGSSDNYVLLGGGGHKAISDFAGSSHSHNYLPLTGGIMNGQVVLDVKNRNISVDDWCGLWIRRTEAVADVYASGLVLTAYQDNGFIIGGGSGSFFITKLVGTSQTECCRITAWNMYVGIGTSSPSYKLHVTGNVGATGFNNVSDIRKKNILSYIDIDINNIARAPIFNFTWNDNKISDNNDICIGTSAQYWQKFLPQVISTAQDSIGTLSLQYDVAALCSAITIAKKTVEHEQKINYHESQITQLRNEILNLKNTDSN